MAFVVIFKSKNLNIFSLGKSKYKLPANNVIHKNSADFSEENNTAKKNSNNATIKNI
jgi:hypothetical protein